RAAAPVEDPADFDRARRPQRAPLPGSGGSRRDTLLAESAHKQRGSAGVSRGAAWLQSVLAPARRWATVMAPIPLSPVSSECTGGCGGSFACRPLVCASRARYVSCAMSKKDDDKPSGLPPPLPK